MRSRYITGMTVLLSFVFAAMASNVVWARSALPSLDLPLTSQEQAARLRVLAGPSSEVTRKLYPSAAETVRPSKPMSYYQRNYRSRWFDGTLDSRTNRRARLGERIGEQGRARYAAEQGLIKLLGSRNRGIRQGPDSVYLDRSSGRLRVLEAKGGSAQLKSFFGSQQGTNQNTLRSAKNVLTRYWGSATPEMKIQMARVILAGEKGLLDTGVIKTTHVLGEPSAPKLVRRDTTNVAREARRARREIIKRHPEAKELFREARREHWRDRLEYRNTQGLVTRGLTVVGFAGALGLGWDAYQQSRAAWSMFDDPALKGSVLPYMQTGMAFGRMVQATTLGVSSTAQLGILKLSAKRAVVQAAGRAFLPVTIGVEGLRLVTAYHEYGMGRISQREFYRRSTGPAVVATFTVGGAAIGAIIGFNAAGVGAVPGAWTGAKISVVVAIPVQLAADYMLKWYYWEFDEQQRRVVNAAVETFYGLEARNEVVQN